MKLVSDSMVLPAVDGLAAPTRVSPTDGLRVIVGKNNAGKSRFLRAVRDGMLTAKVYPQNLTDIDLATMSKPFADRWETTRRIMTAMRDVLEVSWRRTGEVVSLGDPQTGSYGGKWQDASQTHHLHIGDDSRRAIWRAYGHDPAHTEPPTKLKSELWADLAELIAKSVVPRTAVYVPTNRHFSPSASIGPQASLGERDTGSWATYMVGLRDESPAHRATWEQARDRFRFVTEGLDVDFFGPASQRFVHIVDGKSQLPLEACGDGLRDLLAVVLFLSVYGAHDILLEEPGIRLHPAAQRRLLSVLEEESRSRAVWLTTHDGVFVAAPSADMRFSVRRTGDGTSEVAIVTSPDDIRELNKDLGWRANDAFLAEEIVYCEGPSDRLVIEAIIAELGFSARRPAAVVSELGGCGVIWGRDRSALKRTLKLLREIAPHARHVAVLDSDGRPQHQVSALEQVMNSISIEVRWLPGHELEESFCAEPFVRRLIQAHLEESGLGQPPGIETIVQRWISEVSSSQPSIRLNELFQSLGLRNYDKVLGAKTAAIHLKNDSPADWQRLVDAVGSALERASPAV